MMQRICAVALFVAVAFAQKQIHCNMGGGIMPGEEVNNVMGTGWRPRLDCKAGLLPCKKDGGSAAEDLSVNLNYSSKTGKFKGSIKTNLCNAHPAAKLTTPHCGEQLFPDPAFDKPGPMAAPLLGRTGLSFQGVNIYGPLEAGFLSDFVCTGGCCSPGVDLKVCESHLDVVCTSAIDHSLLPDECGGHAIPYHYHRNQACDYNVTSSATHSPIVGVGLDGYGIYGKWEGSGELPQDLDACNGHFGKVPADPSKGITGDEEVYHYHESENQPFTMGCYGPVKNRQECDALYKHCNAASTYKVKVKSGTIEYRQWCPCWDTNQTRGW